MSQAIETGLAICGTNHLECEHGLQLSELQQDDGQVMDEKQSIHQGHSILDDALVIAVPRIQNPDPMKKPVRHNEEEDEDQQEGTEHEHPWHVCSLFAEKQGPGANEENEELEGHGDEESLANGAARLQLVSPQDGGQEDEGNGGEEN